jgi:AbrB family looped-hinge helix DNA binding protein
MAVSTALTRVTRNGQITLPAQLRRAANIQEGDYIEVTVQGDSLLLTPKKLIDKSQAYFWTEEWQKGEREADEDIKAGRWVEFDSAEDLIADLHRQVKDAPKTSS